MNGTWIAWVAVAVALAVGAALPGALEAAALVVLGGLALTAPHGRRGVACAIFVAAGWGGLRAAQIDEAATPVSTQSIRGAALVMLETLPAHGPTAPPPTAARARLGRRTIVVQPTRYGRPVPALRRGWIVAATAGSSRSAPARAMPGSPSGCRRPAAPHGRQRCWSAPRRCQWGDRRGGARCVRCGARRGRPPRWSASCRDGDRYGRGGRAG